MSDRMKGILGHVFDFRKGELPVVLLLWTFFFLIIAIFQILKPLKNGLFVEHYGADIELYAKLANIAVAALGMMGFAYLHKILPRWRLIYVLCGFFIAVFVMLTYLLQDPGASTIWGFYLIGDLETTLMVVAFWAYATDLSSSDQAKRLFGAIGAGGVIGGWAGISFARSLLKIIGMEALLLIAAALMGVIPIIVKMVERQVKLSGRFQSPMRARDEAPSGKTAKDFSIHVALEGARLVLRSKYLAAIVGILGFYEITSQVMDYQFKLLTESLRGVVETQAYMANVYFFANLLAVIVQLFLVSLIMRKAGLTVTLLVMPVALLASSVTFLAVPTLLVASLLVISDNGLNYSIQQTGRETLYVVTSPAEKYNARAFTNMFVQRAAKGLGIFAAIGLAFLGISARYLSLVTITVLCLMVACSIYAGRRFRTACHDTGPRTK